MEKAYKIARAKIQAEKLAHKVCTKMLKIMQQGAKMPKNKQQMSKAL